ncbi:MAG: Gfo/Idh/MocA family oxidoreductase [Actinomycetota bacterium]|jgi:predicted dehydrogenase
MVTRIGVIGTGMMGCEHIRNVNANPNATVTAISDPHEEPLNWARKALGADNSVAEFRDHRELMNSGEVDAVIVASPNFTHHELLLDILRTNTPVLVEKPMCTTVEHCQDVVALAQQRSALTWVGLEYRYMTPIARLVDVVNSGELGDVKMLSIREHRFPFLKKVNNWNRFSRNTGGTLVEKCCHFFDLMNLIAQSRPVRVMASGSQDVNHLDEYYDGERSDILDNAYVIVEFANSMRAMLDLSMFAEAGRNEQEIAVVGSHGKAEAHIPGPGHIYVGNRSSREIRKIDATMSSDVAYAGAHFGASYIEIDKFVHAVSTKSSPEVTVNDGLWSVILGVAAHRSIDERRVVEIAEFNLRT